MPMGEDGSRKIETDEVKRKSLTAVESRRICRRERELSADERMPGLKINSERYSRDEDVLGVKCAHAAYPTEHANCDDTLSDRHHDNASIFDQSSIW